MRPCARAASRKKSFTAACIASHVHCVPQAASEGFRARNELDLALHSFASAALDRHWAANRAELDGQLAQFKALREKAERLCEGATQECYWNDNGCAYHCLDRISRASTGACVRRGASLTHSRPT